MSPKEAKKSGEEGRECQYKELIFQIEYQGKTHWESNIKD